MPEQKVILIGAGGHAASVSDSANMAGIQIVGYVDEVKTGRYLGRTIFKRIEDIPDYRSYLYHIAISMGRPFGIVRRDMRQDTNGLSAVSCRI